MILYPRHSLASGCQSNTGTQSFSLPHPPPSLLLVMLVGARVPPDGARPPCGCSTDITSMYNSVELLLIRLLIRQPSPAPPHPPSLPSLLAHIDYRCEAPGLRRIAKNFIRADISMAEEFFGPGTFLLK